ncbi:murein transglycosylase domain-containing protein [Litoribacillus peritrichatus]|uniref:Membrane-bound lytic murein transglycosylase MltC n=1 Tax=Litoribacillus peritrichatus TaxID=718191 RepID=A0ABP7MHR0_9GAMM
MSKRLLTALTTLSILCSPQIHALSEFEQFKQQHLSEAKQYKAEQTDEFKAYVKANKQAFKQYKAELATVWGKDVTISGKTNWVTHTEDLTTRQEVDFKKEEIRITMIADKNISNDQINKDIEKQLALLSETSVDAAQKADPISQRVAEIVKNQNLKPNLPPLTEPDLKPVITLTENPAGSTQAKEEIRTIIQTAKIIKKPAPKPIITQPIISQPTATKPASKPTAKDKQRIVVTIPMPKVAVSSKAGRYKTPVKNSSEKWKIDSALVLAVIHTESSFNPMARSHIPAYGLMQIVPRSAGQDASALIYGNSKMLSSHYLYTPNKNINVGTAYLHILDKRYLRKIKNPESRLYCTIAAYNTGAGNVARAFTGKTSVTKAASKINAMTPFQVYNHLLRNLPHNETKDYLKRVASRYEAYKKQSI